MKKAYIELLRLIGCFMVIMAHIQLPLVGRSRLFFSIVKADNVPLFFLITGFFFFASVDCDDDIARLYKGKINKYLVKIYIPALLYTVIISCIDAVVSQEKPVIIDWKNVREFINLTTGSHLWYICIYASFVFFFPLLAFVCQDREDRNKIRRAMFLFSFIFVIIGDIQYYFARSIYDFGGHFWGHYYLYLILGFEISVWLKHYSGSLRKLRYISVVTYVAAFALKFMLEIAMESKYGSLGERFGWLECSLCYVTSASLFLLIYSIQDVFSRGKLESIICNLGARTFSIYLWHGAVIRYSQNVREYIFHTFNMCSSFIENLGYIVLYGLFIFAISGVIGIVFEKLYYTLIGVGLKKDKTKGHYL